MRRLYNFLKKLMVALVRRDSYSRYLALEAFSHWIYPPFKLSEYGRMFFEDEGFLKRYQPVQALDTTRTFDRRYVLDQLFLLTRNLSGATAECGVYQGTSSYLICNRADRGTKNHYLFDSFEGLSKPQSIDGSYWKAGDMAVPLEQVKSLLKDFNFIRYFKGWIPEKFKEVEAEKFSFVHIDVDIFQPTYDSVHFFYSRMERGGVIIFDDYGFNTCPGARQAVDSFMKDKPEPVIQLPTGQAFVVKM